MRNNPQADATSLFFHDRNSANLIQSSNDGLFQFYEWGFANILTDIPTNILRAIESILRKSTIGLKYNNEASGRLKAGRCVRQGDVLSAHLFFYIDSTIN